MPTDICERTLFVNKIIRRYEDDVPAVKQRLRESEDRLLLEEISSLRTEVSRLSAELEGVRKAALEEAAAYHDDLAAQHSAFGYESNHHDLMVKLHRQFAAAIRQKGERG